jgi:hypothetical protein
MLNKLNLQNSYDKVKFFTLVQFLFVLLAFVTEALVTQSVLNFSFSKKLSTTSYLQNIV